MTLSRADELNYGFQTVSKKPLNANIKFCGLDISAVSEAITLCNPYSAKLLAIGKINSIPTSELLLHAVDGVDENQYLEYIPH